MNKLYDQPKQRITSKRKGKKWGEDNVRYYSNNVSKSERINDVRMSRKRMIRNYGYVLGRMSTEEIEKANNPLGLEGENTQLPALNENTVSLISPSLNTLIGEEWRRNINYRTYVVNDEAISSKEEQQSDLVKQTLMSLLNVKEVDEKESQKRMEHLKEYLLYDFQSSHERMSTQILKDYWERLRLRRKLNEGWKDVLIVAEEAYKYAIKGDDIDIIKCDPKWLYRVGSSSLIEESEVISEESYMSKNNVIESYGEYMTTTEIDQIYEHGKKKGQNASGIVTYTDVHQKWDEQALSLQKDYDGVYDTASGKGEIRVLETYWASLRDIGILKYIDEETGEELEMFVDGSYKADEFKGEKLEIIWVTEWWQGTILNANSMTFDGSEIIINVKPCELQRRDPNNIYVSYPPFVGTVYNINDHKALSTTDELIKLQRKWTIFEKKVDHLWSINRGKLIQIDISKIPKWTDNTQSDLKMFKEWMAKYNIMPIYPFNDVGRGQMSAQFGGDAVKVIDAELSQSISTALDYMNWLMVQADRVVGVNEQRRGEGAASEGLGVQQERIVRSTHQTEELFSKHDDTKMRLLQGLLEYGKYSYRNGNKRINYVLDDLTITTLMIDGEQFSEADYGIRVMNSSNVMILEQKANKLEELAMSNGTPVEDMFEIMATDSLQTKARKLRKLANDRRELEEQMKQQEMEYAEKIKQMETQTRQQEMEHEVNIKKMELDNKLMIEQMKIEAGAYQKYMDMENDTNHNLINDNVEIEKQQMQNDTVTKKLSIEQLENEKDRKHEKQLTEMKARYELEKERLKNKTKTTTTK